MSAGHTTFAQIRLRPNTETQSVQFRRPVKNIKNNDTMNVQRRQTNMDSLSQFATPNRHSFHGNDYQQSDFPTDNFFNFSAPPYKEYNEHVSIKQPTYFQKPAEVQPPLKEVGNKASSFGYSNSPNDFSPFLNENNRASFQSQPSPRSQNQPTTRIQHPGSSQNFQKPPNRSPGYNSNFSQPVTKVTNQAHYTSPNNINQSYKPFPEYSPQVNFQHQQKANSLPRQSVKKSQVKPYWTQKQPVSTASQSQRSEVLGNRVVHSPYTTSSELKQPSSSLPYSPNVANELFERPKFTRPLPNFLDVAEGESVHLRTEIIPKNDPSVVIEWYKDGQELTAGSRFNTSFELGVVILYIMYVYAEDAGSYYCVVRSPSGVDQTNTIQISVMEEEKVDRNTQLSQEMMERHLNQIRFTQSQASSNKNQEIREEKKVMPRFVKQLQPQSCDEGKPVHFETRVLPLTDPDITVEWFKNGQPLVSSSRYNVIYDRGFAVLDILGCRAEDEGQYVCVATNSVGQARSNIGLLRVSVEDSVITTSQFPESILKTLSQLENPVDYSTGNDLRYQDEIKYPCAPSFDICPEPTTTYRNGPAKFIVKVSGHPIPNVSWYIDNELVVNSPTRKVHNDGSINYLDILRCEELGRFSLKVLALNVAGQASEITTLVVIGETNFRPELKAIERGSRFEKLAELRKVECTPELQNALHRQRPNRMENLILSETEADFKAKKFQSPEVLHAEQLYADVTSRLRVTEFPNKLKSEESDENDIEQLIEQKNVSAVESIPTSYRYQPYSYYQPQTLSSYNRGGSPPIIPVRVGTVQNSPYSGASPFSPSRNATNKKRQLPGFRAK